MSLAITTTTAPDGVDQVDYSLVIEASGGTEPYTFAVTSGSLPTGLTLDGPTGEISGTPSTDSETFEITVTDSAGSPATDAQTLTIHIYDLLEITTASLDHGQIAVSGYTNTLATTGGHGSVTWEITGGVLPAGLSLNASTGEISGTPTSGGAYPLEIEATDSAVPPQTATIELTLTIWADLRPSSWIANYDSDGTDITIPIASLPGLTSGEADPDTGDIRAVLYRLHEALFEYFNGLDSNDQPNRMALRRDGSYDATTEVVTHEYRTEIELEFDGLEVTDEE